MIGPVAPRVRADAAELLLGEVPALAAEADARLHVLDRARQLERLLGSRGEDVKRQPLSRPPPDAGELRELRDEVLDGRAQHGESLAVPFGHASFAGWLRAGQQSRRDRAEAAGHEPGHLRLHAARALSAALRSRRRARGRRAAPGSSGSIARGSIVIETDLARPFAFTVTIPPPAEGLDDLARGLLLRLRELFACMRWASWSILFMSKFIRSALHFFGVERLL